MKKTAFFSSLFWLGAVGVLLSIPWQSNEQLTFMSLPYALTPRAFSVCVILFFWLCWLTGLLLTHFFLYLTGKTSPDMRFAKALVLWHEQEDAELLSFLQKNSCTNTPWAILLQALHHKPATAAYLGYMAKALQQPILRKWALRQQALGYIANNKHEKGYQLLKEMWNKKDQALQTLETLLPMALKRNDTPLMQDLLHAARKKRVSTEKLSRWESDMLLAKALQTNVDQKQKRYYLEKALERCPYNKDCLSHLALFYIEKGMLDEAQDLLKIAWRLEPNVCFIPLIAKSFHKVSTTERLEQLRHLVADNMEHSLTHFLLASTATEACFWSIAQEAIQKLSTQNKTWACYLEARLRLKRDEADGITMLLASLRYNDPCIAAIEENFFEHVYTPSAPPMDNRKADQTL